MAKVIEIPENIWSIINRHCAVIAKNASESFSQNTFCEIQDLDICSPIEQALYSALKCVQNINCIVESEPEYDSNGKEYVFGLSIDPQFKLGNYRADFLVSWSTPKTDRRVIVECDSQQFHDRTERERRYEKARDRFFILNGYKTLHYTGTEILQDPYKVATEIISFVTNCDADALYEAVMDIEAE